MSSRAMWTMIAGMYLAAAQMIFVAKAIHGEGLFWYLLLATSWIWQGIILRYFLRIRHWPVIASILLIIALTHALGVCVIIPIEL